MTTLPNRSYKTVAKQFLWFIVRVLRTLVIVAVLYMVIGFGVGWFLPHTLIILTLLAMLWYFVRSGEWTRFTPRALFVLAAGMIAIIPSIALEREWRLGGGAAVLMLTFLAIICYFVRTGEGFRFSLRTLFVFITGIAVITATATQVPWRWGGNGESLWPDKRVRYLPKQVVVIEVIDKTTQTPIPNAEVIFRRDVPWEPTTQQGKTNVVGIAEFQCRCNAIITRKPLLKRLTTYRTDGWSLEAMASGYDSATNPLAEVSVDGEGEGPLHFRIELEQRGEKGVGEGRSPVQTIEK